MLLAFAACAPAPRSGEAARPETPAPAATAGGTAEGEAGGGAAGGDSAQIARLEAEARLLARTAGCAAAGQCRTAPVGSRPCGGPRTYLAYCAATTDTAALLAKLDELRRAEDEYNRKSGMMSTCEFRTPPRVELAGGSCRMVEGPSLTGAVVPQ
jgi:hypothetical protein